MERHTVMKSALKAHPERDSKRTTTVLPRVRLWEVVIACRRPEPRPLDESGRNAVGVYRAVRVDANGGVPPGMSRALLKLGGGSG